MDPCCYEAWAEVIPNFPFGGQMWSKTRFNLCWLNGRPYVCPRGKPEKAFVSGDYPPESETADSFVWDAALLARYDRWVERWHKRAGYHMSVLSWHLAGKV